jgi:molybdate transport system substrate-binding protein
VKRLVVSIAVLSMILAGCSSKSSTGGTLTVFAASSLTKAFTQIGRDFQAADPGVTVTFNFGSSSTLAGQIESEHTADVFASASGTWMDHVSTKVGVSGRVKFASNDLVLITPTSNPAQIASIADLAKPGVKLVLAAKGVPVGDYAMTALTNAGIAAKATANVVSFEPDDASVVAKITSGEADAAIVYVSDVSGAAATQVNSIPIPSGVNVVATYPIAVVNGSRQASLAQSFVEYVTGTQAQATLKSFGFATDGISP